MNTRLLSILTLSACVAAGCGDLETDAADDEAALWILWGDTHSPPTHPEVIMGMALSTSGTAYAWNGDGFVCRGTPRFLCNDRYPFSTPGNTYKDVRAVATNISNWVYAWHADKTYSIGDSANLTSRYTKRRFDTVHQMSQLIDAFNASDSIVDPLGRWYYYWRAWGAGGWNYWRTVGTADRADTYEAERTITVHPDHGDIVGIDYNRDNGRVYTWYSDGYMNSSTSRLNLGQL